MENNRNYFIAIALSVLIVLAVAVPLYEPAHRSAAQGRSRPRQAQQQSRADADAGQPAARTAQPNGAAPTGQVTARRPATRRRLRSPPRVTIDTPALSGSINLTGARLDDLKLKSYHETVDDSSPIITLLQPVRNHGRLFRRARLHRRRLRPAPCPALDAVDGCPSGDEADRDRRR